MTLCPFSAYKHILGIPNKGLHRFKFLGTSVVDYLLTLISAALTTWIFQVPLVMTTVIWFIVGTILHILFGVPTDLVKYLGFTC